MTYKEIIQEAKNKLNTLDNLVDDWVSTQELAEAFQIWDFVDSSDRLKSVFVKVHYCTDTWVGESVIFLDEEAVCIRKQSSRKGDKEFYFISEESRNKVYNLLLSLSDVVLPESYVNLDEEISDYYYVEYSGQIIHKFGYVYNSSICEMELVKINNKYANEAIISQKVNITYVDRNVTEDIHVNLVKFKYNQSLS